MFDWFKPRKPVQATEKARNALGVSASQDGDGIVRLMVEAANFVVQDVAANAGVQDAPTPIDIAEAVQNAALENVGPERMMIKAHRYEVATHLETAARMVEGLTARGDALHVEGVADYEDFERFKAEKLEEIRIREEELQAANARRAAELSEVERLLHFYRAAPELTAPGPIATPTPASPLYLQQVGRGTRADSTPPMRPRSGQRVRIDGVEVEVCSSRARDARGATYEGYAIFVRDVPSAP